MIQLQFSFALDGLSKIRRFDEPFGQPELHIPLHRKRLTVESTRAMRSLAAAGFEHPGSRNVEKDEMSNVSCRGLLFPFAFFLLILGLGANAADNSPDTIAKYLGGLAVPANATPLPTTNPPPRSIPRATVPAALAAVSTPRPRPGSLIPDRAPPAIPPTLQHSTVPDSEPRFANLGPAEPGSAWATHSEELDRAWKQKTEVQLAAIAHWAPNNLGSAYRSTGTMFYMFSGPDFLYAHAFFPDARTYILVGNEPVGPLPDLTKLPPNDLEPALANIRHSLESVLNWSFFITKDMKVDLTQPQLSGTLPLLYLFLARANCTIDSVTPVAVDDDGTVVEQQTERDETKIRNPGVRIVFRSPSTLNSQSSTQILYYFCTDLSDDGIKSTPGLMKFCEHQGQGVSLLKAASYLMHEPGFSRVRQFLLERSDAIVQDDSGIPFRYFAAEPQGRLPAWNIQLYGPYLGPIDIFKKYGQQDLADAFATMPGSPLPFGFGYQWAPRKSNLMVAIRR